MPWYRVFSLRAWFFSYIATSFCLMLEICLSHLSYMTAWSIFFLYFFLAFFSYIFFCIFFSVKYFESVIFFTDNAPMRLSLHRLCYYLKFWLFLTWAKFITYFSRYFATVDGGWGAWITSGSECSVTCGRGSRIRIRSCSNPAPVNGGQDCPGAVYESKSCLLKECPGE